MSDDNKNIIVEFTGNGEKTKIVTIIESNEKDAEKIDSEFIKELLEKINENSK